MPGSIRRRSRPRRSASAPSRNSPGASSNSSAETDLLHRRKQAVLSQLASLSALAEQTASAFPDLDDPTEPDGEAGDQTVLRPESLPPAGPADGEPKATEDSAARSDSDLEVDGDATVFVSASDLPAGTEHLPGKEK